MTILDRISDARTPVRYSIDTWISDYLIPSSFTYNGVSYPLSGQQSTALQQTLAGSRAMEVANSLPGYAQAIRAVPPAFAAQLVRALTLSQARFTFRNPPWHARTPRRTFGTGALGPLEKPWRNATTGELLSRMEWHAGLAGNAYVYRAPGRLRVLRPDWVGIVHGSRSEPDSAGWALDSELLGYVYANGGIANPFGYQPRFLLPDEVAHWSPIPDPCSPALGQSWISAGIPELQSDRLATEHKIKFFENGATPNLVVKGIPAVTKPQFDELVDMMEEKHAGVANAYRTLYLTAGADATVVGSDLSQIDFKATQGAGETRLSVISRVPAAVLGISEGLQGSALNAGNFGAARRTFADTWIYPTLQDLCAALSPVVTVPADAELWFDVRDIPILWEDAQDAANIAATKANAIRQLADGGFDPSSVVTTIAPEWATSLVHSGLLSVQLQEPGAVAVTQNGQAPAEPAAP